MTDSVAAAAQMHQKEFSLDVVFKDGRNSGENKHGRKVNLPEGGTKEENKKQLAEMFLFCFFSAQVLLFLPFIDVLLLDRYGAFFSCQFNQSVWLVLSGSDHHH